VYPNPADDGTFHTTRNLYTDYSEVTVEEVAASNRWYRQWGADPWHSENLYLTALYFQNNTTDLLWRMTYDKYSQYNQLERGGPLFFHIMLSKLLSNTEESAKHLETRVKDFKITDVVGEDIDKVISLLRGAMIRLSQVKRTTKVPSDAYFLDMTRYIIAVFQTTSVPAFNETFAQVVRNQQIAIALKGHQALKEGLSYENVFTLAENRYQEMVELGHWTGVHTKGTGSVFNATQKQGGKGATNTPRPTGVCWNCGGDHLLTACTRTKNEALIEANKQLFRANKQKKANAATGTTSNNQGSIAATATSATASQPPPPKSGEPVNKIINGKPMYYHPRAKKWVDDKRAAGTAMTTSVPAASDALVPYVAPTSSTAETTRTSIRDEARRLAFANAAQTMTHALNKMSEQFH
jgi:hypothetical protein